MNFSSGAHYGSPAHKENLPPSTKRNSFQHQRSKPRTVLGVVSENELRGRSFGQVGDTQKVHSSVSDNSQSNLLGCLSSSGCDVYVEEACEVVLAASGMPQCLFPFVAGSRLDASCQSEHEDSQLPGETFCAEYADDIYRNLKEKEKKFLARKGYLERHAEITSGMRVVLVDWLVEVSQEYMLSSETLYLAVNYVDRFLSCTTNVKRNKLQLVGTASLLIAATAPRQTHTPTFSVELAFGCHLFSWARRRRAAEADSRLTS
uniref:G2/mitotic-specific cyclin-B2 n=1 Tax=Oryzias sinensis TaxID=183150 RepID=A0A8C7YQT8_9TELE